LSYGTEYPYDWEEAVTTQERLHELALKAIRDSMADVAEEEAAELPDWGSYEPLGRAGPPSEVEEEAANLLLESYTTEADFDEDGFCGSVETFDGNPRQALAQARTIIRARELARRVGIRPICVMRARGRGRERRPSLRRRTRAAAGSPGRSTDDGPLPLAHSHRPPAGVAA
jgi:hypothetical protein